MLAGVQLVYCVSLSNKIKQLSSNSQKQVAGVEASSTRLVLQVSVVGVRIVRPIGPSSIGVLACIYTLNSRMSLKHFVFAQALVQAAFCVCVISLR
jgi:hypothetical protein